MSKIDKIERGDTFWARLDPTIGAEIQKTCPVIVISINLLNAVRRTITNTRT